MRSRLRRFCNPPAHAVARGARARRGGVEEEGEFLAGDPPCIPSPRVPRFTAFGGHCCRRCLDGITRVQDCGGFAIPPRMQLRGAHAPEEEGRPGHVVLARRPRRSVVPFTLTARLPPSARSRAPLSEPGGRLQPNIHRFCTRGVTIVKRACQLPRAERVEPQHADRAVAALRAAPAARRGWRGGIAERHSDICPRLYPLGFRTLEFPGRP